MPLTHATYIENLESILKFGIQKPNDGIAMKNFSFANPNKIYLLFQDEENYNHNWGDYLLIIDDGWVKENSEYLTGYLSTEHPHLEENFVDYLREYNIRTVLEDSKIDFSYRQVTSDITIPTNALTSVIGRDIAPNHNIFTPDQQEIYASLHSDK